MSRLWRVLLCVLALLVLRAAPARALGGGGADPDSPRIDRIEFPFGSPMSAERWSPVVVHISSGSRAVQGWVEISYPQDGSENVALIVPAATTPGVSVPIELVAAPPHNTDQIVVRFVSERFRTFDAVRLSTQAPPPETLANPVMEMVRVLEVGDGTLRDCLKKPLGQIPEPEDANVGPPVPDFEDALAVDLLGDSKALPHAWLSYQGADVIVSKASELARADARAKSALLQWIGAGGRLVVIIDSPSPEWKMWVPGSDGLLQVDEPQVITPGGEVMRATLERWRQRYSPIKKNQFSGMPEEQRETLPLGTDDRPAPAATRLAARVISVTKAGEEKGWISAWGVAEHPEPGRGLLARGPVGLGVVTLIGVDVARLRVTDARAGARNVWLSLLADERLSPLSRYSRAWGRPTDQYYGFRAMQWNSGVDALERTAIRQALDQVTPNPQIGSGVFYGIAGCLLLLGVGIGPLERWRSKRRATSRWHISRALLWIGAMSLAGLLLPMVMRRGDSVRGSCEVVDVLDDTQWRCGVVSSYSARPESVELPREASSAWRGVSTGFSAWEAGRRVGFGDLRASLLLADGGEEAGSVVLAPASQAQWTVRTFQFQMAAGPREASIPRVRVIKAAKSWRIDITEIPGGVTPGPVMLATKDGRVSPNGTAPGPGENSMTLEVQIDSAAGWDGQWQQTPNIYEAWPYENSSNNLTWPALALSGARERDDAIAARVKSGRYACVMVQLNGMKDGISTPGRGVRLVRLVVPIEEEPAP
ncbi:MAG: hypothetical protein GC200_11080 [Tepidisphaera sp.]|nr:hypothetical protein [Tepidisphaera sp.]